MLDQDDVGLAMDDKVVYQMMSMEPPSGCAQTQCHAETEQP